MSENRIESFEKLEGALKNLSDLSNTIQKTLTSLNGTYEEQGRGWSSSASSMQENKMVDYATESEKIAKNVNDVSEVVQKFKAQVEAINEEK